MRRPKKAPGKRTAWASAASWLRRRREKVKAAVAKGVPADGSKAGKVQRLASTLWSESHEEENQRSKGLERVRRFLEFNLE